LSFDVTASGYVLDATVQNQSMPIGLVPEVAGPAAQSQLSSLPQGMAFASFPYPGDTVVGVPGLVGALIPGTPQLPPYPFYASASLGGAPAEVNQPGVALHAEAGASSVQARAVAGTGGSGGTAISRVDRTDDGGLLATASATVNTLSLGGLGTLGAAESSASATITPDGTVRFKSSLTIAHIGIPALRLTIPKQTPGSVPLPVPIPGLPQLPPVNLPVIPLPLGGTTLDAPDLAVTNGTFAVTLPLFGNKQFAVPASAIASAFKALGIDLAYQAPQITANSIVAPQLTLKTTLPAPPAPISRYYSGPTTLQVVLGRSTVNVAGVSGSPPSTATPGSSGDTGGGAGSLAGGNGAPDTGGDPPGGATPATATDNGTSPALAIGAPGSVQAPALSPGGGSALGRTGRRATVRGPLQSDTSQIYLVVVGAALIGLFANQALRLLGVRHRWI
jgi:hypothetical protein